MQKKVLNKFNFSMLNPVCLCILLLRIFYDHLMKYEYDLIFDRNVNNEVK